MPPRDLRRTACGSPRGRGGRPAPARGDLAPRARRLVRRVSWHAANEQASRHRTSALVTANAQLLPMAHEHAQSIREVRAAIVLTVVRRVHGVPRPCATEPPCHHVDRRRQLNRAAGSRRFARSIAGSEAILRAARVPGARMFVCRSASPFHAGALVVMTLQGSLVCARYRRVVQVTRRPLPSVHSKTLRERAALRQSRCDDRTRCSSCGQRSVVGDSRA